MNSEWWKNTCAHVKSFEHDEPIPEISGAFHDWREFPGQLNCRVSVWHKAQHFILFFWAAAPVATGWIKLDIMEPEFCPLHHCQLTSQPKSCQTNSIKWSICRTSWSCRAENPLSPSHIPSLHHFRLLCATSSVGLGVRNPLALLKSEDIERLLFVLLVDMPCDMTWHDMTWHDMTWHDMTLFQSWALNYVFHISPAEGRLPLSPCTGRPATIAHTIMRQYASLDTLGQIELTALEQFCLALADHSVQW